MGDRLRRRRPHRDRARPRHARRFRGVPRGRRERLDLEIALDLAWQCSPDHPWVREHPEWFRHRPDGTIKYAENPPKKYQDIYPLDFECDDWRGAVAGAARRHALLDRSRRPHLPRRQPAHQDVRLLGVADRRGARARSRRHLPVRGVHAADGDALPREGRVHAVVHLLHLAQHEGGADRLLHRADDDARRASTCGRICSRTRPTSCTRTCSTAGAPAFETRLLLAATLGASYGIYSGFELCENQAVPGTEEYADSEKYQFRTLGLGSARPHQGARRPGQRDPPQASRAAVRPHAALSRDRQPADHRLQQARAPTPRTGRRDSVHRRQPRSAPHAARASSTWLGCRRRTTSTRCAICSTTPSTPGAATGTTCGSTRTFDRDTF